MSESTQIAPVPPECDLRGLQFMPLYGDRLFASATWISASAEEKVAALRLWWHAYAREVPASSLPDDDKLLAEYAGYGVAIKAWLKMKPAAMRGWVKCTDGRWYHPVVAELALEAWAGRVRNREKQRKWRERNHMQDGDVPVTRPLRNAGEGEGQGELQGQGEEKQRAGRGARLPADWQPTEDQVDFCKAERPDLDPAVVAARFRDYWVAQPGVKGRKVDWAATWRNWVRNERRAAGAQPGKQDRLEAANAAAARAFAERDG